MSLCSVLSVEGSYQGAKFQFWDGFQLQRNSLVVVSLE